MDATTCVAFCPHCGNRAPQSLVYRQEFWGDAFASDGAIEEQAFPAIYFVAVCQTCHQVLIYLSEVEIPDDRRFARAQLMWPDPGSLPKSTPDAIRDYYQEASRIKNLAPNAYAVQVRRALEALCDDRKAKKATLQRMLAELASRGEIPPVLAEMTEILRLLGNIGAHAASESVKPGQVPLIDEFFRAVVEYVYVAPAKIRSLRESLSGHDGPAVSGSRSPARFQVTSLEG